MADRKRIDAAAFRDEGFLQEANRQFFHPHGLALETTRVTDEPSVVLALTPEQFAAVRAAAEIALTASDRDLWARFDAAVTYDIGATWISGCWDERDDPEGVVFGDEIEDKTAKAGRVVAERERHREARIALFGADTDIEPLGWIYTEEGEPNG